MIKKRVIKKDKKILTRPLQKLIIKFNVSLGDNPELSQIVKKPEDDLQIISKEAIMEVDNEVIVDEKITID